MEADEYVEALVMCVGGVGSKLTHNECLETGALSLDMHACRGAV